jgi:hypothetical protein
VGVTMEIAPRWLWELPPRRTSGTTPPQAVPLSLLDGSLRWSHASECGGLMPTVVAVAGAGHTVCLTGTRAPMHDGVSLT